MKAIPLVNTELEMAHLFGLSESANAKIVAKKKLQEIPTGSLLRCSFFNKIILSFRNGGSNLRLRFMLTC